MLKDGTQSKYHNRRVEWAGEVFDSQAERDDFIVLSAREQGGEITGLLRQVSYVLQWGFTDNEGKKHKPIYVVWDFCFFEEGQTVCWDTKGFPTPEFRLKEKLFRKLYPDIKLVINRRR